MTDTDRKALATRTIVQAAIIKALRAVHDESRAELFELFEDAGEREVGNLAGQMVGTAALQNGRETWAVVDDEAFLEWVSEQNPREIVSAVRESFTAAILAACKRDGGVVLDEATGEVGLPPGVAVRHGATSLVVKSEVDGAALVRSWLGDSASRQLGIEAGA